MEGFVEILNDCISIRLLKPAPRSLARRKPKVVKRLLHSLRHGFGDSSRGINYDVVGHIAGVGG